ncbi:MAG: DUF2270 domain-containing protein [Acidobacteria bacterium]|nr:MAG: DUF2270 domain-containing protein [Acidobacteriota bacterium]
MSTDPSEAPRSVRYSPAELTTLAHLYRGEMYRSKVWRTRLDTTTNWAVATTGIALSVSFSDAGISPVPLLLISLLVMIFLNIEARRYRYFDIWRTRVRLLEVCFYGPMLRGEPISTDNRWNEFLAHDYQDIHFHISFWEAAGRRLRRNYIWIFIILAISYLAKLAIHPEPVTSVEQLFSRAAVGPIPGRLILFIGVSFYVSLTTLSLLTLRHPQASGRVAGPIDIDPRDKYGIQV